MLRATISNEVKYGCFMYTDCDEQIIVLDHRFLLPSWMWGSRGKNYSKVMGNSSTIDPYNSTITRSILTKNASLKR